jgi:opacity protein-like surface antigen
MNWLRLVVFLFCISTSPLALGQANQGESSAGGHFDLGLKTGSFLPFGIEGVRDLLPLWGLKFGHDIGRTLSLEYDFDMANAKGVTYYLGYFSLRHDFTMQSFLPLFFLIGVDAHYYKRRDTYGEITGRRTEYDFRFSTGWHLGFGSETKVYEHLFFRADFRMGFSPGRQLVVALSAVYRFK